MSGKINYVLLIGLFLTCCKSLAQQPQDNWYLEQTWTKDMALTNGGLSAPIGVAIGPDQRIYVGDPGAGQIQVYMPDGTYIFSITNGFGGGESFSDPRGMICDRNGNLYVADNGNNCVYVFNTNGNFVQKIGGSVGSGTGELDGVDDVAVSRTGDIYVLERTNVRVSVFDSAGAYIRSWGQDGALDGQLQGPTSIAISPNNIVYITQCPESTSGGLDLKAFTMEGVYLWKKPFKHIQAIYLSSDLYYGPTSVRVDDSGIIFIIQSGYWSYGYAPNPNGHPDKFWKWYAANQDGTIIHSETRVFGSGQYSHNSLLATHHGIGPDGTMFICNKVDGQVLVFRHAFRNQWAPPRNAIPMPTVTATLQRENSSYLDIDYVVTDADDSRIETGLLIFTNTSSTAELEFCIPHPTLVENTSTNLGTNIAANIIHRLTWNPGADWSTSIGEYRVGIMAKDSRQNLLDIHYLNLPAANGMPALKISRSPLNTNDFMQVWWWLLATDDPGITLTSAQIHGTSGSYSGQLLCDDGASTDLGRAYIYEKMNIREATPTELDWARQANMPSVSSPNQWAPTRQVAGRPKKINEWGFDTGSWGSSDKWVVPLD